MTKKIRCAKCHGWGTSKELVTCGICGGKGKGCKTCKGKGKLKKSCHLCNGQGWYKLKEEKNYIYGGRRKR